MMVKRLCQWLPEERITRIRNLALLMGGLYLGRAVHLSMIVRHRPLPGKLPSLVNRLRRFLNNPRVDAQTYYRPLAQRLVNTFAATKLRLVIDCSAIGFNHRVLTVSVAYRKRALPLAWSFHQGSKGHITADEQIELLKWVHLTQRYNYGPLWLVLHWAPGEDEPWYLLSDQAEGKTLIGLYKIRMWTEEMYGDLKKHGFDLESTHLQNGHRLSRLICESDRWLDQSLVLL